MSHRYSTALSHIVLAGTGIWCLNRYGYGNLRIPHGTFGLIVTHSLIGIWRWGNPDYGMKVDKPYQVTRFLQRIFALPCIACQLWLTYNYQREIAYLHLVLSLIPLTQYIANKTRDDVIDGLLLLNVISTSVVSYLHENYFGIAAALSFFINHFCVRDESDFFEVPNYDLYNYGMCFFTYFSLRALMD